MGIDRYDGLDGDTAEKLLTTLPKAALAVRQGKGPSAGSMLTAAATHKGVVEVMGYGVGPGRQDERLSVEGVHIYDESITSEAQARARARDMGMTSGTNPSEIAQVENPWRPGEKAWRLIWD
jgi:hypothetical protein